MTHYMCAFIWCTNTNTGGDHEKTAQPIVRANRRCFKLPFFDPAGKASCFPKYLFEITNLIPNCIGSYQEGQVMYRTSSDCRKGWLRFFPVQVRKNLDSKSLKNREPCKFRFTFSGVWAPGNCTVPQRHWTRPGASWCWLFGSLLGFKGASRPSRSRTRRRSTCFTFSSLRCSVCRWRRRAGTSSPSPLGTVEIRNWNGTGRTSSGGTSWSSRSPNLSISLMRLLSRCCLHLWWYLYCPAGTSAV